LVSRRTGDPGGSAAKSLSRVYAASRVELKISGRDDGEHCSASNAHIDHIGVYAARTGREQCFSKYAVSPGQLAAVLLERSLSDRERQRGKSVAQSDAESTKKL